MLPPPPPSTLFPYTTLFRSERHQHGRKGERHAAQRQRHQRLARDDARAASDDGKEDRQPTHNHGDGRKPSRQKLPSREPEEDRKSTRLNSSHLGISYAVFCL